MKTFYTCLFSFLAAISCTAQYFTIDTARADSPYNKEVSFIFPTVANAADPIGASAINSDLIASVLEIDNGKQKESIFENIWGKHEMDIPSVGQISFKIINNDADFFSLSISATSCKDACENWTRYYVYDSKTGRKAQLSDIFTGQGVQYISDSVRMLKNKRIQDYVDTLKYALNNKPLSGDDKRDIGTAIDLYTKCIQTQEPATSFSSDKQWIIVHANRCLPYDLLFFDKVDRDFTFNISSLQTYMSEYGRSLYH